MSQIFHRSANTIARVSIFGAVFFVAGFLVLIAEVNRSPWVTGAHVAREQPMIFTAIPERMIAVRHKFGNFFPPASPNRYAPTNNLQEIFIMDSSR